MQEGVIKSSEEILSKTTKRREHANKENETKKNVFEMVETKYELRSDDSTLSDI